MHQFCDPFDNYNTASTMYDVVNGSPVISSSYARHEAINGFPNQGIYFPSGSYVRKNLKSNQSHLIGFMSHGCALPPSSACSFFGFGDNGVIQVTLGVQATGALAFYRGGGGTPLATSATGIISPSSIPIHGIEIDVIIGASGSVKCWLDGEVVIPLTSANTSASGSNYANQLLLGTVYGTGIAIYSDYVRVWDATGTSQNAALGQDVRKLTKLVHAAGDLTQWTASAGSNYQCVDENPPDDDTTYVWSDTLNFESYDMGSADLVNLPYGIASLVARSRVRKDDGAERAFKNGVRSNGQHGLGATATVLSTGYQFVDTCIPLDPDGDVQWTPAKADAAQHLKYETM